jgi:hypothetical protein
MRAVTFYVDNNDAIVGVALYNVFGDGLLIARKIIADKRSAKNIEDVARLFRLYSSSQIEEDDEKP